MKRKFVALLMIAIMALTVATFAVTVTPASAASTDLTESKTPQIDQIQIGRPMVWSPWLYDYHRTWGQKFPDSGPSDFTGISQGGMLATKETAVPDTSASAYSGAELGVKFHLKGVTTLDQDKALWSKPVTITALVTYKFTGSGSGDTYNDLRLRGGFPGPGYAVSKSSSGTTYTITKTVLLKYSATWHLIRDGTSPGNGFIYVSAMSQAVGGTGSPTYASTVVTVHALGLTWK